MITMRAFQSAAPLALVAMLALFTAAAAQDTPTKQKAPTKETKEPKEKKKPAEKKAVEKEKKPAKAAPGGGQPTLLGQFGDWGAYTATSGAKKVCYALAKPASSQTEPANKPRDPAYIFVSTRPAENVRNEVSIVIGYPFKPGSEATADHRLGQIRDVHASRRRLDQERRRGSPHGRRDAQGGRDDRERRVRQGHEVDRPLFAEGAGAGARPRRQRMQVAFFALAPRSGRARIP